MPPMRLVRIHEQNMLETVSHVHACPRIDEPSPVLSQSVPVLFSPESQKAIQSRSRHPATIVASRWIVIAAAPHR